MSIRDYSFVRDTIDLLESTLWSCFRLVILGIISQVSLIYIANLKQQPKVAEINTVETKSKAKITVMIKKCDKWIK